MEDIRNLFTAAEFKAIRAEFERATKMQYHRYHYRMTSVAVWFVVCALIALVTLTLAGCAESPTPEQQLSAAWRAWQQTPEARKPASLPQYHLPPPPNEDTRHYIASLPAKRPPVPSPAPPIRHRQPRTDLRVMLAEGK